MVLRHGRYEHSFARTISVLILAFKILKAIKKPIYIDLEDNHLIFWRPYRLSVLEKIGVQVRCRELLAARLIEPSNGEYACPTVMPSKKNIFGNWTEKRMCGDYCLINHKTKSDRYFIPIPMELFNAIGFSQVFSTLDLRSGYH